MKKKAAPSVLMLTFILLVSIFVADSVLAQVKRQPYQGGTQPTVQPQPIPSRTPTLSDPPKVTYFKINNNAATTSSRTVTLNNRTERASQYRASQRPDFYGAQWRSLIPAPQFTLGSGDAQKRVYFQVKNSMGQYSAVVIDTINLVMSPIVTSFNVTSWENAGDWNFETRMHDYYSKLKVNTQNSVKNGATQLRISGKSNFSDTNWQPYGQTCHCRVGRGIGKRTVYFQVKNNYGISNVKTSTFEVPSRKLFQINPSKAWHYSQEYGFKFSSTPKDATSTCKMYDETHIIVLLSPSRPLGSRCDYTLFGGRLLNNGWKFKSYGTHPSCYGDGKGYSVDERPKLDRRQIRFRVHLWVNPGNECRWELTSLALEGPGDAHWQEAFK